MFAEDCRDKLRFRLSDDSGVLRFVKFEIADAPTCREMEEMLREYLVGRALVDVDLEYLRNLACTGNGECMQAVIGEVQRHQRLFVRKHEDQSATC
jgi:hypothetical protein